LLVCFTSPSLLVAAQDRPRFVSGDEVVDFALSRVADLDDPNVMALAMCDPDDSDSVIAALTRLSEAEGSDYCREFRKFRAVYVLESLPPLDAGFMKGILEIGELWFQFDFPLDAPPYAVSFEDYSAPAYAALREENVEWASQELQRLCDRQLGPS
jgi:hypothetical protein